ncbi:MAG: restriction endonuclease subunit S [Verrucomicrobiia bacterium]|jgi:type I restriction enzyme S subunit
MKLPAYPKYKPSGVEWLGDVPEKWEVKRLKYSASINDETLPETTEPDFEFRYVDIGGVDSVSGIVAEEELIFENAPSRARRVVRNGDTIVSTVRTYLRAIAPIKNPPKNLIVSTGFAVVRPRSVQPEFLSYAIREASFVETVVARSTGVSYPAVNATEVATIPIPLPSAAEQQTIADFLDRETARLDALVAKNQKLIERLKEKRIALLSHTVTRGLNSKAKLKSSGNDWLGDIPVHWEVLTVRRRAKLIKTGGTPPTAEERYYEDGTVPWFGPGSFDDQIVVSQPVKLLNSSAVKEGAARMFAAGATMVVAIGATLGKVSSLTEPGSCNQQITVIEFDERRVHPRFATYQLKRLEPALRAIAPSATLPILDQGEIADIAIGLPPIPEQTAIAEFLDAETARIDDLVAKVETAVERLQEYRTALITAAVTGKIDVRKAVA